MKVERKETSESDLLDPTSAVWRDLTSETVALTPVPLEAQPNEYIRSSWADRSYGQTAQASAAAISSGNQLYVRLEWQDDDRPNEEFADAAAVVLGKGDAIQTLGSEDSSVNLWYWAEDRSSCLSLSSSGPGVVLGKPEVEVAGSANLGDSRWAVVICGPESAVQDGQVGVALWNGSNDERAGLAAVSSWLSLDTEKNR